MGPSRRSRSSRPREAFQLPAGPSAPAWRPVGWVAGLDAAVQVAEAHGVRMRPVPVSLAYPHCGGLPPASPLRVVEGLGLLAAGPRGASGARH